MTGIASQIRFPTTPVQIRRHFSLNKHWPPYVSSTEMDNANNINNDRSLPGASERIQRILSSTALSRLSQSSSGRASPPVPITQTRLGTNVPPRNSREEMAQAFPALYHMRAYPYNPQRNYSPTSRPGPSHASGSGRSGPSHRPYKQKSVVKNFVKKVVLVEPEEILDEGRVVDMMEFHSDWTEMQTISAIEGAFSSVLASGPSPK